ncbi:MAG TPA: NAD(P)H:quinone oxidoreductase [Anaerolineae bacterium]|nr:NAD(P)H:quinone oxidoreductase [Anaerolineae bacterium]
MAKVLVLFYSTYGHIYRMAEAMAEGVNSVEGVQAVMRRVPETLPQEMLDQIGATQAQAAFADVPVATVDELADYDGLIMGVPTRFGNMIGQMQAFWDGTGGLWYKGALVGKPGGVFTSSATQHGGQETTIRAVHTLLLHHGMVLAGLPYAFQGQMGVDEVKGGSPYGASTITDGDGSRLPSETELAGARWQGRYIAEIAKKLAA